MSSVVKTLTPFINMELLLKALEGVGCGYTVCGNEIITNRKDYYGSQKFVFMNGRYCFLHDSSADDMRFGPHYPWGNIGYEKVSQFLGAVAKEYNRIFAKQLEELERKRLSAIAEEERKKAEEEKQRLERERKEFVEKQRAAIVTKAKEQGYDVQETKIDNKVKLVLVRTVY